MKLTKILTALTALTLCTVPVHADVRVYSRTDLTAEILESREKNHDILIEVCHGVVLDNKGNGVDETGYYISYRGVNALPGQSVVSLFIYNPDNGEVDDILYRVDFPTESRALRGLRRCK